MRSLTLRAALLAAAAFTLLVPPAQAATAITAGAGGRPDVAVDAAGSAHIAWVDSVGVLHYCKIPAGGSACTGTKDFPVTAFTFTGHPFVALGTAGKVVVGVGDDDTGSSEDRLTLHIDDGSGAFATTIQAGTNLADNAVASGDTLMSAGTRGPSGGLIAFQASPLINNVSATRASLLGGPGVSGSFSDPGVALPGAGSNLPVVVFSGSGSIGSGVFFNRLTDGADPNTSAKWTPAAKIDDGSAGRVTGGGPSGAFLMYKRSVAAGLDYALRHYNGTGWDAPVAISGSDSGLSNNDVTEAPNGSIHAVWSRQIDGVHDEIRYATAGFVNPGTVVRDDSVTYTRVAMNSAGQGWVVWANSPTDATNVKAAPLTLIPKTGGPASNQPDPTTDGPVETGPTKSSTDTFGPGGAYQGKLTVPKSCVHSPNRFKASASFRQIKLVRDRRLPAKGQFKALRVEFRFDFKLKRTDKKAPFSTIYSTLGLISPSTHTVTARVFLRQRRFKTVHGKRRLVTAKKLNVRTLSAKVKVC